MEPRFIHPEFLLQTPAARELYHEWAEGEPIIDYHCHLPPAEIAADRSFANLTEVWLAGDHYKWRAMRAAGVDERFVTGEADDWEKFEKWAETVPKTIRNPLYHWTHLELARYFGIDDRLLGPETARSVWDDCNAQLATEDFRTRSLVVRMNVRLICTTDDPTDSLEHHAALAADTSFPVGVLPAFRPDKAMAVDDPSVYNRHVDRLAAAADTEIVDFDGLLCALRKRHAFFHDRGCRLSDHGLESVDAEDVPPSEARRVFARIRGGHSLNGQERSAFRSAMLFEFGLMDHEKDWTQQFHLGALRNTNTRMMQRLGPDTGYDSVSDVPQARSLARLLDRLDSQDRLARTILYNLNPADNEVFATMIGNFQDGRTPGKIQYGSGWWFLDQKDGMEKQLDALSNMGLLSRFVGMLTDSRSFLSYPRHEYFRRILCNTLGMEIDQGLVPRDPDLVGSMVRDICHRNAASYFGFPPKGAS
jgi:glucuronate isomerase